MATDNQHWSTMIMSCEYEKVPEMMGVSHRLVEASKCDAVLALLGLQV
jgi:hypothetical protein